MVTAQTSPLTRASSTTSSPASSDDSSSTRDMYISRTVSLTQSSSPTSTIRTLSIKGSATWATTATDFAPVQLPADPAPEQYVRRYPKIHSIVLTRNGVPISDRIRRRREANRTRIIFTRNRVPISERVHRDREIRRAAAARQARTVQE
ncbi:hypothetical protein S40285_10193 [Stachybotrys chlorohalonatus IBT 40285]|uniref:Uncharacterized protein n=1 Tax=Stachybotrys chlorohalonatus (strain IBT 40285) TaxID=1283841 RepID=A0A084QUD7_STAC4|nr:hypothetical protein S40285_10193 [Stachybotrys chlorohalonata IBT 40285]